MSTTYTREELKQFIPRIKAIVDVTTAHKGKLLFKDFSDDKILDELEIAQTVSICGQFDAGYKKRKDAILKKILKQFPPNIDKCPSKKELDDYARKVTMELYNIAKMPSVEFRTAGNTAKSDSEYACLTGDHNKSFSITSSMDAVRNIIFMSVREYYNKFIATIAECPANDFLGTNGIDIVKSRTLLAWDKQQWNMTSYFYAGKPTSAKFNKHIKLNFDEIKHVVKDKVWKQASIETKNMYVLKSESDVIKLKEIFTNIK